MDDVYKYDSKIYATYAGYYINDDTLKESSSGGMANVLAEEFLERRCVVYGVAYSDDFYFAHYARIDRADDLFKLKGSKYFNTKKSILVEGEFVSKLYPKEWTVES
ncbi:MAG: hypothetical protein IJ600_00140 [Lachnospiraceae bacterium]|nr:hypothetical protein [Lachnospiraceae bacterium]